MDEAQEVFETKERKERKRQKQLLNEGMQLWRQYAEEYRILPYRYFYLLLEKKAAKLKLHKLPGGVHKEDYPEIPFFRILDEREAQAFLEAKDLYGLEAEIGKVEYLISSNFLYVSLKEWVKDSLYQLAHQSR